MKLSLKKIMATVAFFGILPGCGGSPIQPEDRRPLDLTAASDAPETQARGCTRLDLPPISVGDPTLLGTFDPETLGVFKIQGDIRHCLDLAVRDGAEILTRSDDAFTAFYPTRFEAWLDAARERIDSDAVEGRWSETQQRVIPGVAGRKVDSKATEDAFRQAILSGASSFDIVIRDYPALSSDISEVRDFKPTVLLGEYKTVFAKKKNRTINVKLAASSLDGVFLMPGAEFSYNEIVGERSEARGYKEAPVIEQGQTVEGLGGGACQVSSTVHAAALLSGLGILERSNHTLPSSYIPVGMDAVVSYPILDLRVRNTFDRPVVIRVYTEENTLIAKVLSDKPRTGKIMFRREVTEEVPFRETITVEPALEPGTIKIKKRGKVGYKVQRGRIFIENGKERFEKLLTDTYQPQEQHTLIAPDVIYPPPEDEAD